MSEAVFIRVLDQSPEQKPLALHARVAALRNEPTVQQVFWPAQSLFEAIPGSPFAYWASNAIIATFEQYQALQGHVGTVKQGLITGDDYRFLRAWWEIGPEQIGYSESAVVTHPWTLFAKGGAYSPYYADVHLAVRWSAKGSEIKTFLKPNGRPASRPQNEEYYFRKGLTWPRRTTSGFSIRRLPAGCVFGDKGPSLFVPDDHEDSLAAIQVILQSRCCTQLIATMLAAATAAARSYEVGVIQQVPIPKDFQREPLLTRGDAAFLLQRLSDIANETTHAFFLPSLVRLMRIKQSLTEAASLLADEEAGRQQRLLDLQVELDDRVFELYGLPEEERERIRADASGTSPSVIDLDSEEDHVEEDQDYEEEEAILEDLPIRVANLLMWCVGVAFGRWDVRMTRDESLIPELQGPFERLPRVAPGGLAGPDALPATADRIASEAWLRARPNVITLPEPGSWEGSDHITASEYPIEVAWDGVLVDDEGHPRDLVERVRAVLRYVYGERAHAIEEEALRILQGEGGRNPKSLREWFRTQKASALGKSFFDFHIQRYSKSRRKAPIYWRLASSPKGSSEYAVWLYYLRLTDDMLWSVLSEYVHPKQKLEEQRLSELREEKESATGAEARRLEKEIETKVQLVEELAWLESELKAVAERGYAPELDDGVLISAAPLHRVIAWKEPEKTWKKLEKGEYDWAHIALKLWPERVREKCRADKSLAIAHDLEELFEE